MQNYVYLLIKETDTFASFEILCRSVTLRGRLCDAIGTCEKGQMPISNSKRSLNGSTS